MLPPPPPPPPRPARSAVAKCNREAEALTRKAVAAERAQIEGDMAALRRSTDERVARVRARRVHASVLGRLGIDI